MAKKEITGYVKLQIKGGQANPAPPVGPALGQRGINIMEFCKAFNEKTKNFMGKPVPVIITVYKRSCKVKKWINGTWKTNSIFNYKKTSRRNCKEKNGRFKCS